MSFERFPNFQWVKMMATDEVIDLGEVDPVESGFIKNCRIIIYVHGTQLITNETLYLEASDINSSEESGPLRLADIGFDPLLNDWIGYVRFDFSKRKRILNGTDLRFKVRPENYAFVPDTEIGFVYPFLDQVPQINLDDALDNCIVRDIYVTN